MKVIFRGDPIELERGEGLSRTSTSIFGVKFPMGAEVDVSHLPEKLQHKLIHNPHFTPADVDARVPLIVPDLSQKAEDEGGDDVIEEATAAPRARRKSA